MKTHINTLQRTATLCNTLQKHCKNTATRATPLVMQQQVLWKHTSTHCNTLQHTAKTLQKHCNTRHSSSHAARSLINESCHTCRGVCVCVMSHVTHTEVPVCVWRVMSHIPSVMWVATMGSLDKMWCLFWKKSTITRFDVSFAKRTLFNKMRCLFGKKSTIYTRLFSQTPRYGLAAIGTLAKMRWLFCKKIFAKRSLSRFDVSLAKRTLFNKMRCLFGKQSTIYIWLFSQTTRYGLATIGTLDKMRCLFCKKSAICIWLFSQTPKYGLAAIGRLDQMWCLCCKKSPICLWLFLQTPRYGLAVIVRLN